MNLPLALLAVVQLILAVHQPLEKGNPLRGNLQRLLLGKPFQVPTCKCKKRLSAVEEKLSVLELELVVELGAFLR